MFANSKKMIVLIGCMFAATLLVACGSGEKVNPNPTTNEAAISKAVTPPPGAGITPTPTKPVATKPPVATPVATAPTTPSGNGIALRPTTLAAGEDSLAFTPSPPTASKAVANPATPSTGMAGVAATVALAAMAAPPPPDDPVDPCRALPCSDDDDPWLGCRYAAALYRDAPGTTQGVRSVVGKMSPKQLEWYKEALLESYARDLWYSADYRLGDPEDLEQSHRDVKAMVFGNNKDVEAMGEDVICGLLGSTEITLADVIAASRAGSPFVGKKKPAKKAAAAPTEGAAPALVSTEPTGVGPTPDPAATPATDATSATQSTDAPATPDCGADSCPLTSTRVNPTPDPDATPATQSTDAPPAE